MIQFGNKEAASIYIGWKEVQKIDIGGKTAYEKAAVDYFYIENEYAGTNTVTLSTTKKGTPTAGTYTTSIQYSKDKSNWTTYTNLTQGYVLSINLNQGEKVYFRNDNGVFNNYTSGSVYNYTAFTATYSHSVGGNINSLLDYRNIDTVTFSSGCFYRLFYEDYSLVDSHSLILPATTLSERCYSNLFIRCTSMTTTVSELPGTTLAENCYDGMYYSCSSLTTAPDLKATTLVTSCYSGMFANCTLLSSIKVYANDNSATSCTNNWLLNVAGSGTFNNLGSATYTVDSASGIPTGWTEDTSNRFVFSNTVITNVGNDQAQLTSEVQINYTGTWDDGYFEVYNVFDRDRSIHFSPSEISNGVLTASNLIQESSVSSLASPATVTIYNSGTAVWTGSVSFTVVQ